MISKNRISEIRKLHSKKYRAEQQLFLVEGIKSVEMLCLSSFIINEIFVTESVACSKHQFLNNQNVTIISESEMERISTMQTPPDVLAIAQQLKDVKFTANEPIIALDHISDPGNLGTIIRTADWFGIHNIVCSENSVEFYNPKTIQSTMGSFANVNILYTKLAHYLKNCCQNRRILGTFLDGTDLNDINFRENDVIVIGNESNGISSEIANLVTDKITISSKNSNFLKAESLNAAIAAAIVMYKWRG